PSRHPPALPPLPTRRSSDLTASTTPSQLADNCVLLLVSEASPVVPRRTAAGEGGAVLSTVTATPEDVAALPARSVAVAVRLWDPARESTRLNSSHVSISYAV